MSRGPGKIERAIEEAFKANPDDTFTMDGLVAVAMPGLNEVEKKHRVSVGRAAKKAAARCGWGLWHFEGPGRGAIYFNKRSLASYSFARERADFLNRWRFLTDEQIRAKIPAYLVAEGGAWWIHVQAYKAELDGSPSDKAIWREKIEAQNAMIAKALGKIATGLAR